MKAFPIDIPDNNKLADWKPQVLIVDDDEAYLSSVKEALEGIADYRVVTASNPSEAREVLKDHVFDVAVLDLRLTDDNDEHDISGLKLAKQISKSVPKIIMSRYPTLDVVREAVKGDLGSPPDVEFFNKSQGAPILLESIREAYNPIRAHTPINVIEHSTAPRRLRVFLCHSSTNKPIARDLYHRLESDGVDPWLDEKKLLPGQNWQMEIEKAVRNSDMVIVFLSRASISKRGYVQKEIRIALDVADEQPDGTIFIVPLRLEECDIPDRLRQWQWVNYFEKDAYEKLLLSIKHRASEISALSSTTPS